jgi:PadR family transcriptional regulator PadR
MTMDDLTGFRRDLLAAVALLDGPSGATVKAWLKDEMGYEKVHAGRLYPNLNELIDRRLLKKDALTMRTNRYQLTRRGRRTVVSHAKIWSSAAEAADGDDLMAKTSGGGGES